MPVIRSPLPEPDVKVTGEVLQGALVDLVNLSLIAKQVHWNLVGRNFRSIHLQLDEVVDIARKYSDIVAERAVAVGVNPDGRSHTVANAPGLPEVPAGWIKDADGVQLMVDTLWAVVERTRERIAETTERDLVTQDSLLDVAADIEKQAWMFEAQRAENFAT
jgi:starvation-inducible DNA-binding protein